MALLQGAMLQLLHMLDKWTECLEKGGQIDAICYRTVLLITGSLQNIE